MNKNISYIALGVALLALLVGAMGLVGGKDQPVVQQVGASGTRYPNGLSADSTSPVAGELRGTTLTITGAVALSSTLTVSGATLLETLTQGGGTRATSTNDTTATLLASDFDVENVIEFIPNVTGITLTLPASSTLSSFVPNSSDCRDVMIINATSTANASFTLAGGSGSLLRKSSTTAAVLPGGAAVLKACRKADTDILFAFDNEI